MHIRSPSWLYCLFLFLWAITETEVQLWRNLFFLYASETGRASLWYRVPVWTFVSAVHLQTRLVLAETVKSLEQTPSAHYFSIHSDLLSLAFVSDVRRKNVKALKPQDSIFGLYISFLLIVITVRERRTLKLNFYCPFACPGLTGLTTVINLSLNELVKALCGCKNNEYCTNLTLRGVFIVR